MHHDEFRLAKRGIVEHGFEIERIGAGDIEVTAGAGHGVEMDCHAQAAALRGDGVEEIILQQLVIRDGRIFLPVDEVGPRGIDGLEGEGAEVGGFEFFSNRAALFMAFERGGDDARNILG